MYIESRMLRKRERRALAGPTFWREVWHPQARMAYLFLLPAIVGLAVFVFIPFLAAFYFSFTAYNVLSSPRWIGLANYQRLLESAVFWTALRNTAVYTLGTIPPKVAIALVLALLLNRRLRGAAIFRTLFYLPVVTATVAVSVIWLWLFNPSAGLLNMALETVGLPPQRWLLDPQQALPSLMVVGTWKWVGYSMVIYLAGLQGIPETLYEAADLDGARGWSKFRYITLPLLKPATFFIVVTTAIGSFQVFEQIYVMTQGGPGTATTTVVYEIYEEAFQRFNMGYASAMAFVLFVIILALTAVNFRLGRGDVEY